MTSWLKQRGDPKEARENNRGDSKSYWQAGVENTVCVKQTVFEEAKRWSFEDSATAPAVETVHQYSLHCMPPCTIDWKAKMCIF